LYTPEVGTALEDLDTPCLVVDLDVMEKNIKVVLERARNCGIRVRPHMKTTKSPGFARILIEEGATGICVSKLAEAEVMIEAGVDDILITSEIVGEPKVSRLASLATRNPRLRVVIDSVTAANQLNERMKKSPHSLQVLIDVNVGENLCGVADRDAALALAQDVKGLAHLQLIGIHGFEGHLQMLADQKERRRLCHESMKKLVDIAAHLRENGFEIQTVTAGGTGTYEYCAEVEGITEVRPGAFILMDLSLAEAGLKQFQQAVHVMTSVISKPSGNRVVVDAGLKSLSANGTRAVPGGKWSSMRYTPVAEEMGILESADGSDLALSVGDKVLLVPGHVDMTVNLHDNYYCMRENKLESVRRISARGKEQ
jgi:D-serine deaminase-like pyridoxal phosphate-dependent protein